MTITMGRRTSTTASAPIIVCWMIPCRGLRVCHGMVRCGRDINQTFDLEPSIEFAADIAQAIIDEENRVCPIFSADETADWPCVANVEFEQPAFIGQAWDSELAELALAEKRRPRLLLTYDAPKEESLPATSPLKRKPTKPTRHHLKSVKI